MRHTLLTTALLLFAAIFFIHCAAPQQTASVAVNQLENVNFQQFKTFHWRPDAGDKVNNLSQFDNEIIRERLRNAVTKELQQRTMRMVDTTAAADLAVEIAVLNKGHIAQQTTTTGNNNRWNDPYYRNNQQTTSTTTPTFFNRHQLTVNLYDGHNGRLVWSGTLVRNYRTPQEVQENLMGEVAAVLERYPVKGAVRK